MKKAIKCISMMVPVLVISAYAEPSGAEAQAVIEEVMVTAQKRTQSSQDVPLALSVVSGEKLNDSGISSFEALQQGVPGLVINNANSLLLPFIRGVGAFNAGAATSSSVAIYIDGIYTARSSALAFSLDNVEQVEILKGPQSTLYGRNATAGAITVKTAVPEPGQELTGRVKATIGNYNTRRLGGHVMGSINEQIAMSLTGAIVEHDGYVENKAPQTFFESPNEDVNSLDDTVVTGKIRYQPSESADFVFSSSYQKADDSNGFNYKYLGPGYESFDLDDWETYGHWGHRETENTQTSLTANIDFGSMYLVSISGYARSVLIGETEAVAAPVPTAGFAVDWRTDTISQELRLHASPDAKLQWLVGAQYFNERDDSSRIFAALGEGSGATPPGQAIQVPVGDSDWESDSSALFGEVVFPATENLNITLGLRSTWEEFTVRFNNSSAPEASEDWNEITYRLVADYATDWGMTYASYSTGFVSGGYNVQNPGPVVDPEVLHSYEVGAKADLADGRVRVNGAVFFYDYQDIHAQAVDPATGSTNLVSGDKATLTGLEMDVQFAASAALMLNAGVSYLMEREYDDFSVAANGSFPAIEASGNTIAGAPKLSAVAGLEHDFSVGKGRVQTNLNLNYNSGVYFDVDEISGSGGNSDEGYTLLNLQSTYHSQSETWSVGLFINNLLEEHYYSGGISSSGIPVAIEGAPRVYGINVSYDF